MQLTDSKHKIASFVYNVTESTTACLIMMVQGNLLALTFSHWLIASQTGVAAGVVASAAILVSRTSRRWVISTVLGVATAVVDFLIHPGQFGPVYLEALLTGVGAALLSYLAGFVVRYIRARRVSVP